MENSKATVIASFIGLIGTILAAIISPQISNSSIQKDYDTLNSQYISLQEDYNILESNYDVLNNQLQDNSDTISQKSYDDLNNKYTALQGDYESLQKNYESLQDDYNSLQDKYNTLTVMTTGSNDNSSDKESTAAAISASGGTQLTSLTPVNEYNWDENDGELSDSLGLDYSDSKSYIRTYAGLYGNGYAEYYINNQYTLLTGCIAAHSSLKTGYSATVTIYGDDEVIATYSDITRKTERFSIGNLDITGYKFLKIESSGAILFTDFTLY